MNLFLIGYRCTGKTSVGKALADALGLFFVDVDHLLVKEEGKPITELTAQKGWNYFRRREKEILQSICKQDGQVVATGGGVVLDPDNVAIMKKSGRLIWLQASPQIIRERMLVDQMTAAQRPALTSHGSLNEIESILKERISFYKTAMDFSIDTDGKKIEDIAMSIINWLKANVDTADKRGSDLKNESRTVQRQTS